MGWGFEPEIAWYKRYVECFYWSTATMMLVGSKGDTFFETIFCTLTLYITIGFFAIILGEIANVLSALAETEKAYMADLEKLTFYLERKNCPKELKTKMLNYLEHFHGGHLDKTSHEAV